MYSKLIVIVICRDKVWYLTPSTSLPCHWSTFRIGVTDPIPCPNLILKSWLLNRGPQPKSVPPANLGKRKNELTMKTWTCKTNLRVRSLNIAVPHVTWAFIYVYNYLHFVSSVTTLVSCVVCKLKGEIRVMTEKTHR